MSEQQRNYFNTQRTKFMFSKGTHLEKTSLQKFRIEETNKGKSSFLIPATGWRKEIFHPFQQPRQGSKKWRKWHRTPSLPQLRGIGHRYKKFVRWCQNSHFPVAGHMAHKPFFTSACIYIYQELPTTTSIFCMFATSWCLENISSYSYLRTPTR